MLDRGGLSSRLARSAAFIALASCGARETVYVMSAPDGGGGTDAALDASGAGDTSVVDASVDVDASSDAYAKAGLGTAVVRNGDDPSNLKYSHAILATVHDATILMLFLTDRPRSCTEHLAGIDYIGEQDLYYSIEWVAPEAGADAGPTVGTWHFSGSDEQKPPRIYAWYLEHQACGEEANSYGSAWYTDETNFLQLTEVSASRVAGTFITQVGFNVVGWDGPDVMYLEGSFDTVPCVVTSLYPPDPGMPSMPSTTCL
jgi:hypothetical protein